jgi:hypothetical protein
MRFVLVRVISWIVLWPRNKGTVHEITRTNTKQDTKGTELIYPVFDI